MAARYINLNIPAPKIPSTATHLPARTSRPLLRVPVEGTHSDSRAAEAEDMAATRQGTEAAARRYRQT